MLYTHNQASENELLYGLLGVLKDRRLSVYAGLDEHHQANDTRQALPMQAAGCRIRANQRMTLLAAESWGATPPYHMLALLTQAAAAGVAARRPSRR